jgi:hypothetical protein
MRKMMRVVAMVGLVGVFWGPSAAAQRKAQEGATEEIVGDWTGVLSAGGSQLHLVLHVTKGEDGKLVATLDSVDQGANGIPVSVIAVKDGKVSMTVAAVGGDIRGSDEQGGDGDSGDVDADAGVGVDVYAGEENSGCRQR